ncbi:MAG TPA: CoA pyrophosphatase, partial [Anaerolineae bacterium]
PRPREGDQFPLPLETRLKEAGVLILLFPGSAGLSFFLTRRTETVENHKGQVSLPGGSQMLGETLDQTALRETCEELSVEAARVSVLGGPLTPLYIPVSGFRVTTFIAHMPLHPRVFPEPGEVVEIIETPLALIVDEQNIEEEVWEIRGKKTIVPFFSVNGNKVWGATAMILSEFAEMLRQVQVGVHHGVS